MGKTTEMDQRKHGAFREALPDIPVTQQRSQSVSNRENRFLALFGTFFAAGGDQPGPDDVHKILRS